MADLDQIDQVRNIDGDGWSGRVYGLASVQGDGVVDGMEWHFHVNHDAWRFEVDTVGGRRWIASGQGVVASAMSFDEARFLIERSIAKGRECWWSMSPFRKIEAYDKIAKAYGLDTTEENVDECVTHARFALQVRKDAQWERDQFSAECHKLRGAITRLDLALSKCRAERDEAVDDATQLRARVAELERLAYMGDHRFPDLTYKSRLEETVDDLRLARLAAAAAFGDLREIAAACGQRDDEYYRQAIERRLAELTAKANEVPGLSATLDEFGHAIGLVRAWLDGFADSIPEHEYQELASILSDAPWHPPKEDQR